VLDYYLHGGKDHVLAQVRDFLKAASVDQSLESGRLVEPPRALEGLLSWSRTLNAMDPHYRYHLATVPAPVNGEFTLPPSTPGLLYSTMLSEGKDAVRLDVIARYDDVIQDRPDPMPVKVNLRPVTDAEREAVQDFVAYGTPIDRIPADVLTADLLQTFDISSTAIAWVSLMPTAANARPQPYELVATDNTGQEVAVLPMNMTAPTQGIDGSGRWAWSGADTSGTLSLVLRQDPVSGVTSLTTQHGDITGARPRDLLTALTALSAMRAGTGLHLRVPDGPPGTPIIVLPQDLVDLKEIQARIQVCENRVCPVNGSGSLSVVTERGHR
jgi:hypothetical protein